MPRYDFKCRECSAVFEAVVPFNLMTVPCVACNNPDPTMTTLGQAIADRQLCFPATIHVH